MLEKKEIVNRINQLLEEKGISNKKLKQNPEVATTVIQWRKNPTREKNRVPSLRCIEKLCNYLGVSMSYFFAFDRQKQKSVRARELSAKIEELSDNQIAIIEEIVKEFGKKK